MVKTDGESITKVLTEIITGLGLDSANCVGYCFDGAANMCGKNKGVANRLKTVCPLALYVHCYGHRLNLAIQSSLNKDQSLIKRAVPINRFLYSTTVQNFTHLSYSFRVTKPIIGAGRWHGPKTCTVLIIFLIQKFCRRMLPC